MRTHSERLRPKEKNGNGENTLSIVALVVSICFSPVGLVLAFVAMKKEGKNTLNLIAIVIGSIGTFIWVFWMIWYFIGVARLAAWYNYPF